MNKWPTVEDATRRINVLIEGQVEGPEADMAARDLIVLMRELGRVTAHADEAKRAENEACATLAERNPFAQALDIAFAIRARIALKDNS